MKSEREENGQPRALRLLGVIGESGRSSHRDDRARALRLWDELAARGHRVEVLEARQLGRRAAREFDALHAIGDVPRSVRRFARRLRSRGGLAFVSGSRRRRLRHSVEQCLPPAYRVGPFDGDWSNVEPALVELLTSGRSVLALLASTAPARSLVEWIESILSVAPETGFVLQSPSNAVRGELPELLTRHSLVGRLCCIDGQAPAAVHEHLLAAIHLGTGRSSDGDASSGQTLDADLLTHLEAGLPFLAEHGTSAGRYAATSQAGRAVPPEHKRRARAVGELLHDAELRSRLSRAARRAAQAWSPSSLAARIEAQLLAGEFITGQCLTAQFSKAEHSAGRAAARWVPAA